MKNVVLKYELIITNKTMTNFLKKFNKAFFIPPTR